MVDRPPEESDQWDRAREEAVDKRLSSPRATEVEKALSAVVGAAEGFLEEAHRADLPHLAGRAVQTTEDTYRELKSAKTELQGIKGEQGSQQTQAGGQPPQAPTDGKAVERAEQLLEKAQVYVDAVEESSRRALEAPAAVKSHAKVTAKEVGKDMAWSATMGSAAMGFGLATLVLLGIAATILFSFFMGPFLAALLVTVLYAAIAGIAGWYAYKKAKEIKTDARTGVKKVKGEVRGIAKPIRDVRHKQEAQHQ